jgi:hypothetical protein
LPFVGSWGPMSGKRPVRLWMEDRLGTELVHFLRIGHSSEECFGPDHQDATVLLRDGGSIGPAEIALIYGSTPLPGTQVHFAACYSTAGGASSNVMTISFNLDWAP